MPIYKTERNTDMIETTIEKNNLNNEGDILTITIIGNMDAVTKTKIIGKNTF